MNEHIGFSGSVTFLAIDGNSQDLGNRPGSFPAIIKVSTLLKAWKGIAELKPTFSDLS